MATQQTAYPTMHPFDQTVAHHFDQTVARIREQRDACVRFRAEAARARSARFVPRKVVYGFEVAASSAATPRSSSTIASSASDR